MKTIINVLLLPLALSAAELPSGPFLGQRSPGMVPKIFAPGFISLSNRYENSICFTKDGCECYFVTRASNWSSYQILETHYENGQWTTPRQASFSNNLSLCPSLANDDQYLYFSMSSPNIYRVTRTATGWSDPVVIPSPVSSSQAEWSCHISDLGNMWVCSWRSGGVGGCDQWRIINEDEQFTRAENLRSLNTSGNDCGPVPGPNENYIVWMSNRPGGFGGTDLYVSFSDGEGGWTAPRNLGPTINTSGTESSAYLSPDYKHLFYSSTAAGTADVYWVSVEAFLPDPNGTIENIDSGQRFSSIQCAINYADSGETLVLNPGIYHESIVLDQKDVTLRSTDPNDPVCIGGTIIQGQTDKPVLRLRSNNQVCTISGLTLRAGSVGVVASGSNAQFIHCRIMDNLTHGMELSDTSNPTLNHCLIYANGATGITMAAGTGRSQGHCKPLIQNCVIVHNGAANIEGGEPIVTDSIVPGFSDE